MKKRIAVIGATGLIGNAVAKQLNQDDNHVIVLSRNMQKAQEIFSGEFEIIQGDVLNSESIEHSFTGVDGVFISLPETIAADAMPNIIKHAKETMVKRLVYVSGCTVRKENAWHPMIKGHYEAEMALEAGGIPFTVLKPTMVMDMIPRYANNGKPFLLGKQIHSWSWIHTSDIARMASRAFSNEKARNKRLTIWGSEKETIATAVEKYNRAVGLGDKPVKPKPYWLAKTLALIFGKKLKYAISVFKYFEDHPEEGDPKEAYALLGEPEMRLQDFFDMEKSLLI